MEGLVMSVESFHKPRNFSFYPLENSRVRCLQIFLLYGVLLIAGSNANGVVWTCHSLMNVALHKSEETGRVNIPLRGAH